MSTPSRQEVLDRVRALVGSEYVVRWSDARTTRGSFEGADWTLDVFDVPAAQSFGLGRHIGAYRRELRRTHGIGLVVVTHTPEATERHFWWIRGPTANETAPALSPVAALIRFSIVPPVRPGARFEYGIRR
jgi:hypothetical protein